MKIFCKISSVIKLFCLCMQFFLFLHKLRLIKIILPFTHSFSHLFIQSIIHLFIFSQLYLYCMNKNQFSLKRVISEINELVSYNIKLGMLHFYYMNQYRPISLHHMLPFSICFIRCKLSTFLQTKYLTIQRKTRAKKSKVVY